MSYEYYCTGCGARLNNDIVLFDMKKLLVGNGDALLLLKFRITEKELLNWAADNLAGEQHCELGLSDVMEIIANQNNLNDKEIAALSLTDIKEYLAAQRTAVTVTKAKAKDDRGAFSFDDDEEEQADTPDEKEEKPVPSAIMALMRKDNVADAIELTKVRVSEDLKRLQTLFMAPDGSEQKLSFSIRIITEPDDKKRPVVVGAYIDTGSFKLSLSESRVCPKCGEDIFQKAGTALHKSIVFIGARASGKTTAILALTHYAINHMQNDIDDSIWQSAETLNCIDDVELLDRNGVLLREMSEYSAGFAPEKTNISKRSDAYSSTLLIKSHAGDHQVTRILTLTDLPGELCKNDGKLDADRILNTFPVATVCDAFITCFDTGKVCSAAGEEGALSQADAGKPDYGMSMPAGALISNTCDWADAFQSMLVRSGNHKSYVPMMLLYTKCREIEGSVEETHAPTVLNPLQQVYMFSGEQADIAHNKKYSAVTRKLDTKGGMAASYQSMLRCSPLGYAALTRSAYESYKKNGVEAHVEKPTPKNIDKLMKWILCVTGCIPVTATYRPLKVSSYTLDSYYLARPQYRNQKPLAGSEVDEALARVCLFSNPGRYDENLAKYSTQKSRLKMELAVMALSKKGNDETAPKSATVNKGEEG